MKPEPRHKGGGDDIPDVRADEPERAMEQFTDGLRRVLSVPKQKKRTQKIKRVHR